MMRAIRARIWFARFCLLHRRSPSAHRRWQEAHLRKLVAYAYRNVPLWKDLLDRTGVAPNAVRTLAELPLLPVTSKHTFIGKMVEEYVDKSHLSASYWYVTSGTSGTPFRFLMGDFNVDERYLDFASMRFLWWRGESFLKMFSVKLARIKIRGPSSERYFFAPVEEYLRDPAAVLAKTAAFGAEVLSAYPSILMDICRRIPELPEKSIPRPRFVLSFGETLTAEVRKFVGAALNAEIYDRYGLEEIGAVGVECARHDGFHVNVESVIVEVTDENFRPVADGTEGRLLATDLFNTNMPFIRYDTGDRARITHEPCPCGLRSPRIWIRGRYSATLRFPHRPIHHLEFDGAMDGFMNYVLQYQIAKRSDSAITARIIPGPSFHDGVAHDIKEKLAALVGADVRVDVETVTELPITPRGKSRIVLDETLD